ncbi:MAG: hypothetical protein QM784_17790 [Polyangiaceae bacterium]
MEVVVLDDVWIERLNESDKVANQGGLAVVVETSRFEQLNVSLRGANRDEEDAVSD